MKAIFFSADKLSIEKEVPYPPLPVIRLPMMNKNVMVYSDGAEIEGTIKTRDYEFTGYRHVDGFDVAQYDEIT